MNDPSLRQPEPDDQPAGQASPRSFWTPRNVQRITGGSWSNPPQGQRAATNTAHDDPAISGVSIDSRSLRAGELFIALRGERFDGHDFVRQAVDRGAAMLIVSQPGVLEQLSAVRVGVLLVEDSIAALQRLAAAYRAHLAAGSTRVIAVTGSNGKTTTRHLIHSVLGARWNGSQAVRSFNNHIGVPLTLLAAKETDQFVVVELGTSGLGEIAALAVLVKPNLAVITNIASAHLGAFGSRAVIAKEKAAILDHVAEDGWAVVPGDEPLLKDSIDRVASRGVGVVRFGRDNQSDLCLKDCRPHSRGIRFTAAVRVDASTQQTLRFDLPLLGCHNAVNALAAIAVGRWARFDEATIATALSTVSPVAMRLDTQQIGRAPCSVTLINDAYNANPESTAAAAAALAGYPLGNPDDGTTAARRVLVLGDMTELGHAAPAAHEALGAEIRSMGSGIDLVVIAGLLGAHTARGFARDGNSERMHRFARWDQTAMQRFVSLLAPGDVVLIKASRAIGLERLIPQIEAAAAQWQEEATARTRREVQTHDL